MRILKTREISAKIEANLFFLLISQLYETALAVITSNKGFSGQAEILGDAVLAMVRELAVKPAG